MNNPNPFIPQGSMLEQKNKKRARVKFAVVAILSCNILLAGSLILLNGCRRGDQSSNDTTGQDNSAPAVAADTGAAPALPPAPVASTNGSNAQELAAMPPTPPPMPVAPTPAPAPTPSVTDYTVLKGDTLGSIATKFHVKLKDLEAANPTVVPTKMQAGVKLTIPAATMASTTGTGATAADSADVYTVKSGDNLTKIATAHGTTVKELEALNNLKTSAIKVGEKLKLPEKSATASAPIPTPDVPAATASNPMPATPAIR